MCIIREGKVCTLKCSTQNCNISRPITFSQIVWTFVQKTAKVGVKDCPYLNILPDCSSREKVKLKLTCLSNEWVYFLPYSTLSSLEFNPKGHTGLQVILSGQYWFSSVFLSYTFLMITMIVVSDNEGHFYFMWPFIFESRT